MATVSCRERRSRRMTHKTSEIQGTAKHAASATELKAATAVKETWTIVEDTDKEMPSAPRPLLSGRPRSVVVPLSVKGRPISAVGG